MEGESIKERIRHRALRLAKMLEDGVDVPDFLWVGDVVGIWILSHAIAPDSVSLLWGQQLTKWSRNYTGLCARCGHHSITPELSFPRICETCDAQVRGELNALTDALTTEREAEAWYKLATEGFDEQDHLESEGHHGIP